MKQLGQSQNMTMEYLGDAVHAINDFMFLTWILSHSCWKPDGAISEMSVLVLGFDVSQNIGTEAATFMLF